MVKRSCDWNATLRRFENVLRRDQAANTENIRISCSRMTETFGMYSTGLLNHSACEKRPSTGEDKQYDNG